MTSRTAPSTSWPEAAHHVTRESAPIPCLVEASQAPATLDRGRRSDQPSAERRRLGRVPSWSMATHSTTAAEGSEAPRFELSDAEGVAVSVDELLARGPVVLVFLRGFA